MNAKYGLALVGLFLSSVLWGQEKKPQQITIDAARGAIEKLITSESFLAESSQLAPLKVRIEEDKNQKNESIFHWSTRWDFYTKENRFAYFAKSKSRTELYTIRGNFFNVDGKWIAKISEASRTTLFNFFGEKELAKIQPGMSVDEVIKILGVPPGAYFSGEASFAYPPAKRSNIFGGTAADFAKRSPNYLPPKSAPKEIAWFTRAWISNDLAIWVTFTPQGKVSSVDSSTVFYPHEDGQLVIPSQSNVIPSKSPPTKK